MRSLMKYKKSLRITAYFMLITGSVNLLMWLFLILSGQVDNLESQPVAFSFHWISEFATALLLIVAGIHTLKSNTAALNLVFLALGFLLMAIGGAFYFYLRAFVLPMFLFTTLLTMATIVFIIVSYRGPANFIFLSCGVTLYGLINIMGQGFQDGNHTLISMAVPATLFLLVFVAGNLGRKIRFDQSGPGTAHGQDVPSPTDKQQEKGI